jgi:diguanylate cyclase (GGDEF)-like protein/PAS domain S-box-containing protein
MKGKGEGMSKEPAEPVGVAALRRQAEERLRRNRRGAGAPPATAAETRRLVRELQVHQIELEMQNQELVHSREEVAAALKLYADLYDFAPVGYFTLTRDGTIRRANLTGAQLLGQERGRLLKRRFGLFVSAGSRRGFNTFLAKVSDRRMKETCEVQVTRDGGEPLWVHVEAKSSEDGQECHAAVVDISERKKAQEELRCLSSHDALTGLYNRGYFEEQMTRLERGRQYPISLVMADVDHLKETNDRHGHAAGDDLLKRVARVMTAAFRADDVVARLGGDEFGVLLPDTGMAAARTALQRVRRLLAEHNAVHTDAPVGLSLGVSTARKRTPLATLFKGADADMYRDKQERRAS